MSYYETGPKNSNSVKSLYNINCKELNTYGDVDSFKFASTFQQQLYFACNSLKITARNSQHHPKITLSRKLVMNNLRRLQEENLFDLFS